MQEKYKNRLEAGERLAQELKKFQNQPDAIVLALPRGGVPVAYVVAKRLALPMDIIVVRKLGAPRHEELAIGAIASDNIMVLNQEVINSAGASEEEVQSVVLRERQELLRREQVYRGSYSFPVLAGKHVILVDDGIATGATIRAAIQAIWQKKPSEIIVAVPVAAHETVEKLLLDVNQVVCPLVPETFDAVGLWYEDFSQTSDEEVKDYMHKLR